MAGEEQAQPNTEAGTGKTQEDLVEIDDATDEDLEHHISESLKAEEQSGEEAPPPKDAEQPEKKADAKPEAKAAPEKEAEVEMVPKAELEALRKQLKHKELTLQRQATEIGKLRKETKEKIAQLSEGLKELEEVDPKAAAKREAKIEELQKEDQNLEGHEKNLQRIKEDQDAVEANLAPGDWVPGEIEALLEEDGIDDPEFRKQYASNPYFHSTADAIIQFGKRAVERRRSLKLAAVLRKVLIENETLKKKPSPEEVLKKVDAAANAPRGVNGGAGSRASNKTSLKSVDDMSDEELAEILANGA